MTDKTETKAASGLAAAATQLAKAATHQETAAETPKRTPARATLAARLASRQKAHQTIEDRQNDARRLTMIGEAAGALAAQLAGAKARDAAILAEHVVSGATGGLPKLADDARGALITRLAEAEAQAAAAGPALEIVQQKITEAFAEFNRAAGAVALVTRPVIEEEIDCLIKKIREVMACLNPLTDRLIGAGAYAFSQGHANHGDERTAFLALGSRLNAVMKELGIPPQMPGHSSEATWVAFARRLADGDADALVAA